MKRAFLISCFALCAAEGYCQVQQAWVKRYSLVSSATNQATAIALAPDGNLIVAGSSASTNGDLDYLVIKYAPNGQQVWLARYDSPTNGADQLRGLAMDADGNTLLTGTSKTVKLDNGGNLLWTAPYGGRALAAETNGNVYVTGFSELDFATAKLNGTNGTNLWTRTYDKLAQPDVSQVIALDATENVYVAGVETYTCVPPEGCKQQIALIKYDSIGNPGWTNHFPYSGSYANHVEAAGISCVATNVVLTGNSRGDFSYGTGWFDSGGVQSWFYYLDSDGLGSYEGNGRAMIVDASGNVYVTGRQSKDYPNYVCATVKVGTNGHKVWLSQYQGPVQGLHQGNAVALDNIGNVYLAGQSPGNGTGNDIVAIKYDSNGNQLWVQRYDGPAHGDDIATGIVVDNQANVYVTGYSATTNGGTEFVTIKYAQLTNIQ